MSVMGHCPLDPRWAFIIYPTFSNSLIIHAALTQPQHLILVKWMDLEAQ